jgi:hypothetical protein
MGPESPQKVEAMLAKKKKRNKKTARSRMRKEKSLTDKESTAKRSTKKKTMMRKDTMKKVMRLVNLRGPTENPRSIGLRGTLLGE